MTGGCAGDQNPGDLSLDIFNDVGNSGHSNPRCPRHDAATADATADHTATDNAEEYAAVVSSARESDTEIASGSGTKGHSKSY